MMLVVGILATLFISVAVMVLRRRRKSTSINIEVGDDEAEKCLAPSPASALPSEGDSHGLDFHVFLNFKWQDTANSFCCQLRDSLKSRGVHTFFIDEERSSKEERMDEAFRAIERSKIFIPIFSKRYSECRFCLEEITKMVACKRLMLPVFYDVEPREVRNQRGAFQAAFEKYEKDGSLGEEKVKAWKNALKEAGEIKGYDVKNETDGVLAFGRQEGKLTQLIVKEVLDVVNKISFEVAKYPVGLDSRVNRVMELLDLKGYGVRIVGIHGIGGIGKTTLAKTIYKKVSSSFDSSCFLSDIKEVSSKKFNGLVSLQKQLILEVLKDKHTSITSVDEGTSVIKRRVHCKRVLIVLDDVDDAEQIKALAGNRDWFHPKSRLIITTRDKHVLNLQKLKEDETYEVEELNDDQSLQLFSYHAFGRARPTEKYIRLSENIVQLTGGLPLSLEVLGALLFDKKCIKEWENMMEKLKDNLQKDVYLSLKLSYNSLDPTEAQIFLDIACFSIRSGKEKENAVFMWKDCGFFPTIGIKVLLHKSLIKVAGSNGDFEMHDQIRDMGRQIVLQERSPGLRSRLWIDDEVFDLLKNLKGTANIKGIVLQLEEDKKTSLTTKGFAAMSELRLLLASYARFEGEYQYLPGKIKWLEWKGCSLDALPCDLSLEEVVVLDLSYSMITEVWDQQGPKIKAFDKLKVLDLTWCENLIMTPDFSSMRSIVKLVLDMCYELQEVHESIGLLKSLKYLSMQDCSELKKLPNSVCQLTSLEMLDISRCSKVCKLPKEFGDLGSLRKLIVNETRIRILPESMSQMRNLILISLEGCQVFKKLPHWIGKVESLIELKLQDCAIKTLPESIGSLTNLSALDATGCKSLESLPDSVGTAKNLRQVNLNFTAIHEVPDSLVSLDKLEILSISGCSNLKFVSSSIGLLQNLQMLSLRGSQISQTGIRELPESIGSLTKLKHLDIDCNPELTKVPSSLFSLRSLEKLSAVECKWIEGADGNDFGKLSSLKELDLRSGSFCSLPSTLHRLSQLTQLILLECKRLRFLPKLPTSIINLVATDCSSLEMFADISTSTSLQILDLDACKMLVDIPGFENLKSLEKLTLKHCGRLSDALRNRLKEADFERLSHFSISGSFGPSQSAEPKLAFVLPKMFKVRNINLFLRGGFKRGNQITVHIEVIRDGHSIFETSLQHALEMDEYSTVTFEEDHELYGHIRSGHMLMYIAMEGLKEGNISINHNTSLS